MNSSKDLQMHTHVINFSQDWYNFVKPHNSLRVEVNLGKKMVAANSCDGGRNYGSRMELERVIDLQSAYSMNAIHNL
jgi:hypothetical protein